MEDFVLKKIPSAISDTIEHALTVTQSFLSSEKDIFELCTDKEAILKSAAKFREDTIQSGAATAPRSVASRSTSNNAVPSARNNDDMELQNDDDPDHESVDQSTRGGRGRGRGKVSRSTTSTRATTKTRGATKSTRGKGRSKTSYRVDDDEDDDEEELEEILDDDDEEEVIAQDLESDDSFNDNMSESDGESKKRGRGKAKPPAKKAATPKKPTSTTRESAKKVAKEPAKPKSVATPKPSTTTSGPRILASGRSQRKSQDLQLSMTSSVNDEIENDSEEEEKIQTGKRSRSGVAISQNLAVDLTGDEEWSNNTSKKVSGSSGLNITNSNGSTTTTRKPPTQLRW